MRIPSIPHEKGLDSFFIHSLSNSISSFGYANWWVHWLSVFGYYPYSYASAIPFSLSGLSQITGIEMETIILLFCIILGLFSIYSAYLLAGLLYNDFLFKYLMAFFYSISPSIMLFSTWEISSRGPFIIFLPFFLYLTIRNLQYAKRILLLIITIIFLFSIHHLSIIIVPMILIFIVIKVISRIKINKISNELSKNKSTYLNYTYAIGLVVAFGLPFFKHSMAGIIESRYDWISSIMIISIRYIGPMLLFIFGGLVHLILRDDKKTNLWYILCMIAIYIPFIYDRRYGIYIVQLFLIIFLTVGFRNLLNVKSAQSSKLIGMFIIMILVSSVIFSSYYNHYRTGAYKDFWHMDEKTYTTGNWINENISKEKKVLFVSEIYYKERSAALQQNGSSIFTGGPDGLTYGFIEKDIFENLTKVPVTDSYYFSESPYKIAEENKYKDKYNSINWYLSNKDIKVIKEVYDLDYLVQSITFLKVKDLEKKENEKIFSNGILEIYKLDTI